MYDGPKKIETVLKWLTDIAEEDQYGVDALKETEPSERSFLITALLMVFSFLGAVS